MLYARLIKVQDQETDKKRIEAALIHLRDGYDARAVYRKMFFGQKYIEGGFSEAKIRRYFREGRQILEINGFKI
jgi:hypothetical protein